MQQLQNSLVYEKGGKYHSKHVVKERLGKVLWMSEDGKTGVFLSPTRGLVEYSSEDDLFSPVDKDDPRLSGIEESLFPEPRIHTVFGDAYLLYDRMRAHGMTSLLRDVFPADEEYERVMIHIAHTVLRDGGHICCDLFTQKSFISYLFPDVPLQSLVSDTQFFTMMGDDKVKTAFFRGYVRMMRRKHRGFGKACYVDSTPLPNDIKNNPFSKLCCHGLKATDVQMRLALILDSSTLRPVWYEIIPGNELDLKNLRPLLDNAESTLSISVDSLVLDAGYVSKELISAYNIGTYDRDSGEGERMIARMPDKNGYPYDKLYEENCKLFPNAKYLFMRDGHRYFGIRREVEVFGCREYAYVYVDFDNALWKFEQWMLDNEDEFEELTDHAKTRKTYEFGFFVLLSNIDMTPRRALKRYFERVDIECFFKTSKEYLHLLPIAKWTDSTVRGKILTDIISTTIYKDMMAEAKDEDASMTRTLGSTESLMCSLDGDIVTVESPNKNVKQAYENFGIKVPAHVSVTRFKEDYLMLFRCSPTFRQKLG